MSNQQPCHVHVRRCLATLAAAQPEAVLPLLLKQAAPLLDGTNPLSSRLGAVEVMAALMQQLQRQLVPYTVLLVVPLLRRMSDPAAAVRKRAALCFGGLTALLPLAQGMPLPSGLDEAQRKAAEQDAEFLSQLLDNKRVEDYSLPVNLKVGRCIMHSMSVCCNEHKTVLFRACLLAQAACAVVCRELGSVVCLAGLALTRCCVRV